MSEPRAPGRWATLAARHGLEMVLLAACVGLALASPAFATTANLWNVVQSVSETGIIAFGMTLVIVSGEIDLSVGSHAAFAGCLMARLVAAGAPLAVAALSVLVIGAALGCVTGVLRAAVGVPSFITSLGLLTALRGGALVMTGGYPLTPFSRAWQVPGNGRLMGVPLEALIFVAVAGAACVLKDHTSFGRAVHAVGSNAEAARLSGIAVGRVRTLALALTGVLAAASGLLLSSRLMSGNPTVAAGWELDVIAAVIVGGTSLSGGLGRVGGTLAGVLFIGVLVDGMRLLDVPEDLQLIARGVVVLLAVLGTRWQRTAAGVAT